jgi:zeaxanthin glucosyltransferase
MNALLIITPTISHYNASLSMIKSLEKLGYNTFVTANEAFENIFNQMGQKTCRLNTSPFGLNYDLYGNGTNENPKAILLERMNYNLYKSRKAELTTIFKNIQPSIVYIDAQNATDFIPLYQLIKSQNTKVFFLQTTLSTKFSMKNPHYNSHLKPRPLIKLLINNLTLKFNYQINTVLEKIKFLGYDDKSIIKRVFKDEKINKKYAPKWLIPSGCTFCNIPTIYVSPKELEYTSTELSDIYLGNSVENITFNPEKKRAYDLNFEMLYISFGTLNIHKTFEIEKFLDNLNLVLASKPNLKAILSCGLNYKLIEKSKSRWNNIEIFSFVDQHEVLNKSDYFISHGGLNSIKEAIHYNVPMLIYPLEGDQIGNAQKIDFYSLGIAGDIYKENSNAISQNLNRLILDKKIFKLKLEKFRDSSRTTYDIDKIMLNSINDSERIL